MLDFCCYDNKETPSKNFKQIQIAWNHHSQHLDHDPVSRIKLKKKKERTSHVHLQQYFTPHEFKRENFKSLLTWLFHKVHAPRTKFRRHVIFKSLPRSSITLLMISISSLKRGGEGVFLCNFADYLAISSMWRTGFFVVVNLCRSRNSDPKPRDRNTHW